MSKTIEDYQAQWLKDNPDESLRPVWWDDEDLVLAAQWRVADAALHFTIDESVRLPLVTYTVVASEPEIDAQWTNREITRNLFSLMNKYSSMETVGDWIGRWDPLNERLFILNTDSPEYSEMLAIMIQDARTAIERTIQDYGRNVQLKS